ncbi:MAG: DUF2142 domain-containing protein [Candidatus Curtissbacteria bacterium]
MRKLSKILFLAAIFNALTWIIIIPVWQYPDEQAHFAQVQDRAEIGYVPPYNNTSLEINRSEQVLDTERDNGGNNKFTYHPEYKNSFSNTLFGPHEQELRNMDSSSRKTFVKIEATRNPPLYYFLGSLAYKTVYNGSLFDRVYAVRFFSVMLFLLNVVVAYKVAKLIFEKNQTLQITLPTFVAFTPMLVFASTGVLPDPLTNLLFGVVIFICLLIIKFGLSPKYLLSAAVITALGFYTRQQFIIAFPFFVLAIFTHFLMTKSYKKILAPIALGVAVPLFFKLFPGVYDLPEIGLPNLTLLATPEFITSFSWTLRHSYAEILPWYWGVYKWLSLTLPHPVYQIINRLIVVSILGLLIQIVLAIRRKKLLSQAPLIYLIVISAAYFLVFAIGDFLFQHQYGYSFGIQGRYFFPLVIAHLAILIYGFWGLVGILPGKLKKFFLPAFTLLILSFNDFSLYFLASSYYDTTSVDTFINQLSQYKPLFFKGNILFLLFSTGIVLQLVLMYNLIKFSLRQNESN